MGNEMSCKVRSASRSRTEGLLETSEILFRGDFRLKIPFSTIKSAESVDGELACRLRKGSRFPARAAAEKWCEKILHPKSRIEKLGVKHGQEFPCSVTSMPDFSRK